MSGAGADPVCRDLKRPEPEPPEKVAAPQHCFSAFCNQILYAMVGTLEAMASLVLGGRLP